MVRGYSEYIIVDKEHYCSGIVVKAKKLNSTGLGIDHVAIDIMSATKCGVIASRLLHSF